MLALKEFTQLSYQEKKQTLIQIFDQIKKGKSSEDVLFLLNASNAIHEKILVDIYQKIVLLKEKGGEVSQIETMLKMAKNVLKQDIAQNKESKESEDLLQNI